MENRFVYIFIFLMTVGLADVSAQIDKRDVRRGNRDFKKENFREAEIDYRKALVKDSLSLAANYNLANTLYRQGDYAQAQQFLDKMKEVAPESSSAADYYFNLGDAALQQKDYQKAVEAFRQSLVIRPEDLQAKENFIYAKKMLQNQQRTLFFQSLRETQSRRLHLKTIQCHKRRLEKIQFLQILQNKQKRFLLMIQCLFLQIKEM